MEGERLVLAFTFEFYLMFFLNVCRELFSFCFCRVLFTLYALNVNFLRCTLQLNVFTLYYLNLYFVCVICFLIYVILPL